MVEKKQKDFDVWSFHKKAIDIMIVNRLPHEREVWWTALGVNIGSEDDGKNRYFERPVLIFRNFGKENSWIIPMSSKLDSEESRYNHMVRIQGIDRTARLHQLRLASNRRLIRYVGMVSINDFQKVREKLKDLM
jgi:mRNA-degrading endonuclease toxin of MazEF toxin-antitoxin module